MNSIEVEAEKLLHQKQVKTEQIALYRKILKDNSTSDVLIEKRIEYLESLCRGIIKNELNKTYVKKSHARA